MERINSHGYRTTTLHCREGRRVVYSPYRAHCIPAVKVSVLVLEAFVGPRPDGYLACHNNDIKTDDRLANLRWDTRAANHADALRNGKRVNATPPCNSVGIAMDADEIRRLYSTGLFSQQDLAFYFACSKSYIQRIVTG